MDQIGFVALGILGFGGGLGLFVNLLILFLVITYIALVYWTYQDAKRRIEDPVLVTCSVAASLFFPFVGTIVYTILRPPEFIEDREERELELRSAELRLRELVERSCPHCEYPIDRDFRSCPNCERRLKAPCRKCRKPLDPRWGVCPYCESTVRRAVPERERAPQSPGGRRVERTAPRGGQRRPARSQSSRSSASQAGEGRSQTRPVGRSSSSSGGGAGKSAPPRSQGTRPSSSQRPKQRPTR